MSVPKGTYLLNLGIPYLHVLQPVTQKVSASPLGAPPAGPAVRLPGLAGGGTTIPYRVLLRAATDPNDFGARLS